MKNKENKEIKHDFLCFLFWKTQNNTILRKKEFLENTILVFSMFSYTILKNNFQK